MKTLHISVVIAAYKGEKFIGEQLRSLFQQTRLPDEILIGDDSPDDATHAAIEAVLPEAPPTIQINYHKNQTRLGCVRNFSTLIEQAGKDIIFICDQDDVWLPEKIEKMASELEMHPNCEIVFCNSIVTDQNLCPLGYTTADTVHLTREIADRINANEGVYDILRTPMMFGHNIAFRSCFRRLILPMPELNAYDLWIALIAAGSGNLRCIYDAMTLFRRHDANKSDQQQPGSMLSRLKVLKAKGAKAFEEIFESEHHIRLAYERLCSLGPEEIPQDRLAAVKLSAKYYAARLALQQKPRLLRLFFLPCIRGYFRCGSGIKSIIRDLLI